jgi:hypothetical protein
MVIGFLAKILALKYVTNKKFKNREKFRCLSELSWYGEIVSPARRPVFGKKNQLGTFYESKTWGQKLIFVKIFRCQCQLRISSQTTVTNTLG